MGDKMKNLSERQKAYKKFWLKLIKRFNEQRPREMSKAKISETHHEKYLQLLIRNGKIHFEWYLVEYPVIKFQVALHFESDDLNENKELLKYFEDRKEEFQKNFDDDELKFGWDKEPTHKKQTSHMFLEIKTDSINKDVEWGAKTMIKFYSFFRPILDKATRQMGL